MNFFVLGFILFVAAIGWVADFIERRNTEKYLKEQDERFEREKRSYEPPK